MARILVAEDQESLRQFVERALTASGHEVVSVADGSEALDKLHEESFDLLLTDIVMPQLDGIALALRASMEWPDLRILMMTGFSAERERAHNLEALIHDVLVKPFSLKSLRYKINSALQSSAAA